MRLLLACRIVSPLSNFRLIFSLSIPPLQDLIDFLDPTLVIVGSRGLGKLKGTILGVSSLPPPTSFFFSSFSANPLLSLRSLAQSMSHYLVQKSSVPVMIARRRLKRNLKRTDPTILRQGARVPLARAGIEKTTGGKEQVRLTIFLFPLSEEGVGWAGKGGLIAPRFR